MRTNIVQEHWEEQDAKIFRLEKENSDLLADSKRHEELAADRLRIIEAKYPDKNSLIMEIDCLRKQLAEKDKEHEKAKVEHEEVNYKFNQLVKNQVYHINGSIGLWSSSQLCPKAFDRLIEECDKSDLLDPPVLPSFRSKMRTVLPAKKARYLKKLKLNQWQVYWRQCKHYDKRTGRKIWLYIPKEIENFHRRNGNWPKWAIVPEGAERDTM